MRKREADEPRLFDLPLVPADDEEEREDEARAPEPAADARGDDGEPLPLFPEDVEPGSAATPEPRARAERETVPATLAEAAREPAVPASHPPPAQRPEPVPPPAGPAEYDEAADFGPRPVPRRPVPAPFGARLLAALADLGVHAAVAGAGWLGAVLLGARFDLADLPALAAFLLAFSFLYSVVSLAFWGCTPGMAAAGVVARGDGDQPLTFGQTGLRWLAGLLTAALAGLPLLVALTGRSLPDRLSGSTTLLVR